MDNPRGIEKIKIKNVITRKNAIARKNKLLSQYPIRKFDLFFKCAGILKMSTKCQCAGIFKMSIKCPKSHFLCVI